MMPQFIFLILFYITSIISQINGFRLKMIPIDSPILQIFPNPLTPQERFELLANITFSRALNVLNRKKNLNQNLLQSRLYRWADSYYATQLQMGSGEGTFAPFLLLDTGSSSTWVQCESCNPCFELVPKNFEFTKSPSFAAMLYNDPRCWTRKRIFNSCGYEQQYSQSSVGGVLATDRFYFEDGRGPEHLVGFDNIVFGCVLGSHNVKFGSNEAHPNFIAGILGLSLRGPESILKQLDGQIHGKFSYCITSMFDSDQGISTVYFGEDAPLSEDEKNRLKSVFMQSKNYYHLYVNGISVDGKRLAIDPAVFELDETTYKKGFFVDSGAPYTVLTQIAYDQLHQELAKYFHENYGWTPWTHERGFKLCYDAYPSGDQRFPSVVFHFRVKKAPHGEEVDMVMDPSNMYLKLLGDDAFCVALYRNPNRESYSILGAFQQSNFKIFYDIKDEVFSFVSTRCQEYNT